MGKDRFDEWIEGRVCSDSVYNKWRSQFETLRLPVHYPNDVRHRVPYFATSCKKNTCFYDLSHVKREYLEYNDEDDSVDSLEEFDCQECEQDIRLTDVYTHPKLQEEVDQLRMNSTVFNQKENQVIGSQKFLKLLSKNGNKKFKSVEGVPQVENYTKRKLDVLEKGFLEDRERLFDVKINETIDLSNFFYLDPISYKSVETYLRHGETSLDLKVIQLDYLRAMLRRTFKKHTGAYLFNVKNGDLYAPQFEVMDASSASLL